MDVYNLASQSDASDGNNERETKNYSEFEGDGDTKETMYCGQDRDNIIET